MSCKRRPSTPTSEKQSNTCRQGDLSNLADEGLIFQSDVINDRASTFIGIFTPRTSGTLHATSTARVSNGTPGKCSLQFHPSLKTATHRIAAWRKPSAQQSITPSLSSPSASFSHPLQQSTQQPPRLLFDVGHDDDGEKYGGKRVEKVLVEMDVEGTVVVGRWYGGVLLGPARFEHIEKVAREAVMKWKHYADCTDDAMVASGSEGRPNKRMKSGRNARQHAAAAHAATNGEATEEESKARLAAVLRNRDESIVVLRGLLAEKLESRSTPEGKEHIKSAVSHVADCPAGASSVSTQEENWSPLWRLPSMQNTASTANTTSADTVTKDTNNSSGSDSHRNNKKRPNYSAMPLTALKGMEKARDATIGWILGEIEKVEARERQQQEQEDDDRGWINDDGG